MTRQAIIAIVVGVIIVLGAIAAFLYSRVNQPTETSNSAAVQVQEESSGNGMMAGTLVDLLRNQENVRCTFSSPTEEGDASGTIFVSGENMRGDFELTSEDNNIESHMIRVGDTFYTWSDTQDTGIMMETSVDEWAESAQDALSAETDTFNPNEQIDFECSGWTVDSSMFDVPTEIDFISFEGMMGPNDAMADETETSTSEIDTEDQCSICNALTGNAKTVCLQQFNCQ